MDTNEKPKPSSMFMAILFYVQSLKYNCFRIRGSGHYTGHLASCKPRLIDNKGV